MNSERRILIVDDQEIGRETLEALLSYQGYELLLAASGSEAIELAKQTLLDLILLDVMMPGMDGFEVCQILRSDPVLGDIPIIMVTTLEDRQARLRGFEVGADDFITKPFDKTELRMRVNTIIRLGRYRHLLREREQRQQAETEKRFKDKLISNISHELRTPLSIITLLSGNLDAFYDKLDDTKRRQMVQNIRKHTQLLNELVENVLAISILDHEQSPPILHQVDIAPLIREEIEHQQPLARAKNHQLSANLPDRLMVRGNIRQLRQLLSNLLTNAIKYTPDHGTIICECTALPTATPSQKPWPKLPLGEWVGIRVMDNGIGINEADIPLLFERFYRVENQSTIAGTGLGLAIVQEVVEQHQGEIHIASTIGEGTTFAVYLPKAYKE